MKFSQLPEVEGKRSTLQNTAKKPVDTATEEKISSHSENILPQNRYVKPPTFKISTMHTISGACLAQWRKHHCFMVGNPNMKSLNDRRFQAKFLVGQDFARPGTTT